MNLSKSRYCRGIQCRKMLWLARNKPEFYDETVMRQDLLAAGNTVGDLAMSYFGDYIEVPYDDDKSQMIARTSELIASGAETIAEASFAFDGNFCSVDILRVYNDGVDIIEVKSSTSIKDIYLDDMAYQCWVLANCGLTVRQVFLMHLNNQYVRRGELELDKLFLLVDCSEEVFSLLGEVGPNIEEIKAYADADTEPDIDIGKHCDDPYECGYKSWCWRHIPANSIFEIRGRLNKFDLYYNGIVTMEDALRHNIALNAKQLRQVEAAVYEVAAQIETVSIRDFLQTLSYPLYFLDFETYMPAIPEFDGVRPYMQIPFQYSLHIKASENAQLEHREFLAKEGTDPRRALAENLCRDIPADVCVVAFNMTFEKTRLIELANFFPDLSDQLLSICHNMRDLMVPFQQHWYYCRELCGSYSIKQVLPALCPDDPELDYQALEGIHNGEEAMAAFPGMVGKPPEEIEEIRRNLLNYCRLDTLAMVRIWEKLKEMC